MTNRFLRYLIVLAFFSGCAMPYELSQRNLSYLYQNTLSTPQPSFILYHHADTLSTLYFQWNWSDFQYTRRDGSNTQVAQTLWTVTLRDQYESKNTGDTTRVYLADSIYFGHEQFHTDSLVLNIPATGEFLLEITTLDINSQQSSTFYLTAYKDGGRNQQFFLVRDADGIPAFTSHIPNNQLITITAPHEVRDSLWVRYYHRDFPIATPPFTVDFGEPFNYKEDSIFKVGLSGGTTAPFSMSELGFYHFQIDSSDREGLTCFRFPEGFPELFTPADMLTPLRYITSSREYDKLIHAPSVKLAIDSFWLENSGNLSRAKTLISKYYNRVQDANRLFTSYLEGWKTDRGMIYIIFGPPNHVYRGTNTENWVYGDAGRSISLRFGFVRVNNPFTHNDFSLSRNPFYKEQWFNAVENWRR